jgi:hypothetical protein
MNLWTPPGVDLGEFAGPEPDPRMTNFLGGLDANGQPLPMTYRRLRAAADDWIITDATPEGPARLLKAARDMFALGFYQGLGKVRECLFHGFLMSVRQLGARALAPGHTSVHT